MQQKEVFLAVMEHLFAFDSQHKGDKPYTVSDFTGYLNAQQSGEGGSEMRKISGEGAKEMQEEYRNPANDLTILLVLMYRYAKGYIKKALKDSLIQTADEFGYLIQLTTYESMTKTEIITSSVMEKTSGTEVIKRLVNNGLMREFADPDDKRSVRVAITPKGFQEVMRVLPDMGIVSKIVVGDLSATEINTLFYLLKKLDFFHNDIYLNKRNAELSELVRSEE
jgi:DNA-binding MarR family transcriptional regulator